MIQYASEFNPALTKTDDDAKFYWKNDQFSYCDAMAYYCLIRKLKPKNIVEIGSGFSTLVAIEAVKKNEFGKIHCFEPFPRRFLADNTSINLYPKIAQHISSEELNSIITEGDILFIDSTHTVKTGSDCNHIYLRLLPSIKQNFHIHVHDIFLPFGLPQNWLTDSQIYWTEQYLLYAFLLDNPKTKVFYSSYYGYNFVKEKLEKIMNKKYPIGGGSLWFNYNNK
ncbi:MAG TPA: class I SAM-dependent methyltransferase [bacterium]|nr:class I SAM-dependent methyltransferase [bacterium]HPN67288.1 class I SAM-dependent methyltransferase [bacterium]